MVKVRSSLSRGTIAATFLGLTAAVALPASQAHASGFSAARFGGEHGHPTTDNPTSIYYNPAGMALSEGTHIFVDGTLALRWASYDRPALARAGGVRTNPGVQDSPLTLELAPGANDGKATLFNAVASPFLGVSSDFGTDFIYGGAAIYFPFGGSAVWDKNSTFADSQDFPGAVDGVQRWYSIDGTIRSMYITGALAFDIKRIGLSIGVSGSAIRSEVNTVRARNADGTDDLVTGTAESFMLKEGRSAIDVTGWQGGFGIGLVYDVLKKGKYFLGISYTSQPNVVGGMTLEGELTNLLGITPKSVTEVEVTQTLPDILRFGVRVRPTDKYEIRLFGDYTRWSVFENQCVLEADVENRECDYQGAGNAFDNPAGVVDGPNNRGVTQHLPRYWQDAGGVRLGGSYWFIPEVEGYLGVGYDSTAIPLETLDPALMDAHKMSIAAGVRWQIIKYLALSFTATELIFFETSTKGRSRLDEFGLSPQGIPEATNTLQPSGDGVYSQFFQLFNLYADISF